MRVPASGGAAVPAAKLPADRWTQRLPSFLPDGNHFLYVERGAQRSLSGRLMLGSLDGLPPKLLIEQASNASFTRGQLFYVAGGNLLARAFDPDRLEFAGAPIPIAQDIEANYFAVGDFSVSASTLVYRPTVRIRSRLVRITRDGRQSPASDQTGYFVSLTMSRDGGKVVVTRSDEGTDSRDLWLLDLGRAQLTRVTFFSSIGNPAGVFSPDGSRLAVSADTRETSKAPSLSIQQVSGMGSAEAIPVDDGFTVNDWSADGRFLLGVQESAKALDVSYLDLQDRKTRRLVTGPTHESMPRISPEGRWLAYVSNESGRSEVYVTDFPNAGQKWQVSKNGGVAPQWSSGGRELWFRSWDAIYVCAVATGPHGIELGEAEQLMRLDHDASIAAAPDGSYAIVTQPLEMQVPAPLEVVRNWTVPSIRSGGN